MVGEDTDEKRKEEEKKQDLTIRHQILPAFTSEA